ncbi:hypothetical protein SAMN04487934_101133 [Eubacterium ruminantium]|nr:hypothetical protein SAMN04487934_101133 [Eubacterium ruminantium]
MIRIDNMFFSPDYKESDIRKMITKLLRNNEFTDYKIVRRSLDARKKDDIRYNISVNVQLKGNEEKILRVLNNKNITLTNERKYQFPYKIETEDFLRPVIIGTGPAGYFAANILAENGFRPIVFERGKCVEERSLDIENFWAGGQLNVNSNVSFGEGGAGTFSDGKLNTGNKDKQGIFKYINEIFYSFGASEEILYDTKPHIGTDKLVVIMKNMRENILRCGGAIHFSECLTDIKKEGNYYLLSFDSNGTERNIKADNIILAIGHSARDTFKMLYDRGFKMEQKPFAVGLRIEHKSDTINESQYGIKYKDILPAADYKLTYHADNGRAVFSFCMCPGGYVVNASSEEGCMVVNGMSYSGRDSENSNSALVVNILPEDIEGDLPLDAVEFQRLLEESFYKAGEGSVPVQKLCDFEKGQRTSEFGSIKPLIKGKFLFSELKSCLPEYVSNAIIDGIRYFGTKIKNFDDPDAVLSGIESRTSSPVRIIRNDNLEAVGFDGIFPSGEGAGYAGGITSAAADGIKCAEKLAERIMKNINRE